MILETLLYLERICRVFECLFSVACNSVRFLLGSIRNLNQGRRDTSQPIMLGGYYEIQELT